MKRKKEYSYDPACEDLARHFLPTEIADAGRVKRLSQHIQEAVESWLDDHRFPEGQCPDCGANIERDGDEEAGIEVAWCSKKCGWEVVV